MKNRFGGFPDDGFETDNEPNETLIRQARNKARNKVMISIVVYSLGTAAVWLLVGYYVRGTP